MWMEVETCGESRKVAKSVLISIYTPVISLSLEKQAKYAENRTTLLAIIIPPATVALFGAVFAPLFYSSSKEKLTPNNTGH